MGIELINIFVYFACDNDQLFHKSGPFIEAQQSTAAGFTFALLKKAT